MGASLLNGKHIVSWRAVHENSSSWSAKLYSRTAIAVPLALSSRWAVACLATPSRTPHPVLIPETSLFACDLTGNLSSTPKSRQFPGPIWAHVLLLPTTYVPWRTENNASPGCCAKWNLWPLDTNCYYPRMVNAEMRNMYSNWIEWFYVYMKFNNICAYLGYCHISLF